MNKHLSLLLIGLIISWPQSALAEESGAAPSFDYPELMVTPRASEALLRHGRDEKADRWRQYLQIQIPAAINLFTGIRVMNEKYSPEQLRDSPSLPGRLKDTGMAATAISGGWLGLTLAMGIWYEPYTSGLRDIRRYPGNSPREQLVRERIAEEHLANASRLASRLSHLSVISQTFTSVLLMANSENREHKIQAAVGGVFALSPYVFRMSWIQNYRNHQNYKKRIFGPLTSLEMMPILSEGRLGQAVQLSWQF